jgi:hypothetical protein
VPGQRSSAYSKSRRAAAEPVSSATL